MRKRLSIVLKNVRETDLDPFSCTVFDVTFLDKSKDNVFIETHKSDKIEKEFLGFTSPRVNEHFDLDMKIKEKE